MPYTTRQRQAILQCLQRRGDASVTAGELAERFEVSERTIYRDVDALSAAARDLAERAKNNHLTADEYKGSTFTVSNLGMFGVESFTPIINQPDAAILGVNCTEDELVMEDDGTIAKHQVLRISLTFDHRLLDGAVAAKFEMTVRDLLEHPMDILL